MSLACGRRDTQNGDFLKTGVRDPDLGEGREKPFSLNSFEGTYYLANFARCKRS